MRHDSETRVTEKGQVTIPVEVRRALGIQPRDLVRFEYDAEREVAVMRRADSAVRRIYGAVTPRRRPEDFRALRDEFERATGDETVAER